MSFPQPDVQPKQVNKQHPSRHMPCPKPTSTTLDNTLWYGTRSLLLLSSVIVLFFFANFSVTLLRLF